MWRTIRSSAYVIGIIIFYAIPLSFVTSRSFCMFYHLLNIECGGCGFSRSVFTFMHGQFATALDYNKMVIALPIVLLLILEDSIVIMLRLSKKSYVEKIIYQIKVAFNY